MCNWDSLLYSLNAAALSAFGRGIVYKPQSASPVAVRGIFQPTREAEEISPGVYGMIFLRAADLPRPPQRGDEVVIGDSVYKVFHIESDGEGAVTLSLRIE